MKALIEYLAKRFVDDPDLVQVNEVAGATTSVHELGVGEGDLGEVIGKHGRTLRALRTIVGGAAIKENRRAILEIPE